MEIGIKVEFRKPLHYYHARLGHHEVEIYDDPRSPTEDNHTLRLSIRDTKAEDEKALPVTRAYAGPDRFTHAKQFIQATLAQTYIGG